MKAKHRRLLCSRPRPPALPPGRPECRAGNKGAAGPRQGGARGPRGGCPEARALPRRPDLNIRRPFLREEPRCEESLRWVGAFYTKPAAGKIGRPGAGNSAPGRLPAQYRLYSSPARPGSAASGGPAPNRERAPGEVGGGPRYPSASCRPRPLYPCAGQEPW